MQQGTASSTAAGAAMQRAAHLVIDGEPKILVDEFAMRFLDERQRARVVTNDEVLQAPHVRASRAHILGRSAFTEDELRRAVEQGCRQYVLLGAGYDSSPARLADSLADVAVFEVDHPDTQAAKRAALRRRRMAGQRPIRRGRLRARRAGGTAAIRRAGMPARPRSGRGSASPCT